MGLRVTRQGGAGGLALLLLIVPPAWVEEAPAADPVRLVVGLDVGDGSLVEQVSILVEAAGGRSVRADARLGFWVVEAAPFAVDGLIEKVRAVDGVRYAHRDAAVSGGFVPDDARYGEQWGPGAIGMEAAWDVTRGSRLVSVAVLDTGIAVAHPDLAGNVCEMGPDLVNGDGDPADDNGHGTHVAGTVAAAIGNARGVAGMANVCLLAVKVLDERQSGMFSDVASGIAWAVDQGADVVSMSLGGAPGVDPGPPTSDAVRAAWDAGVLLVAAAGNGPCDAVWFPAAYAEVVAVGSLDAPGEARSSFSNCGPQVELAGPGRGILSTALEAGAVSDASGYASISGTSMAAPHVAGVAGLVLSAWPVFSNVQVRCVLQASADDLGAAGPDPHFGAGRVDADGAMLVPLPDPLCDGLWPSDGSPRPGG